MERDIELLACIERLPVAAAATMRAADWGILPEQEELRQRRLSESFRVRVGTALRDPHSGRRLRAAFAATQRLAMADAFLGCAVREWSTAPGGPRKRAPAISARNFYLTYTPLGCPKIRWRGEVAVWARTFGMRPANLHVSFSHDGGSLAAIVAHAPDLLGLGIDLVHLPRLRGVSKDRGYLHRFAAQFMDVGELAAFRRDSERDDLEALRTRVAAHFSLMEGASKALGTGLRLGIGYGREGSLPRRSIEVALEPGVQLRPGGPARVRMDALGATRLEGVWCADDHFLLSVVLLRR